MIYGNTVGGVSGLGKSVVIKDSYGAEYIGVVVDKETVMTATPNDIRKGKIAATEYGMVEGTQDIPAYRTTTGTRVVPAGSEFTIPLKLYNQYDYTKLQCIIVEKNTTSLDSFKSEKVVLENGVYNVNSLDKLADVTTNSETLSINLNISNDTDQTYYIKYFTYREEM